MHTFVIQYLQYEVRHEVSYKVLGIYEVKVGEAGHQLDNLLLQATALRI